jgi:hypothetical protein
VGAAVGEMTSEIASKKPEPVTLASAGEENLMFVEIDTAVNVTDLASQVSGTVCRVSMMASFAET